MNTYVFRLLDVDLSNGKTSIHTIDGETIRRFIGGTGLAAWLLWKEGPESPDPLDPTAPDRDACDQFWKTWCGWTQPFDGILGRGQRGRDMGERP